MTITTEGEGTLAAYLTYPIGQMFRTRTIGSAIADELSSASDEAPPPAFFTYSVKADWRRNVASQLEMRHWLRQLAPDRTGWAGLQG